MKSYAELLQASSYANRPNDFDDLIKILDSEIRLITPTDPEGLESAEGGERPVTNDTSEIAGVNPPAPTSHHPSPATRFYQLTHDYLVHSLRDWLTRKQRESRRGRAGQLRLAERSALWNVKPENRHLPTTPEWLRIQTLTRHIEWTPPQRKMMHRANRVTGVYWSGVLHVTDHRWHRSPTNSHMDRSGKCPSSGRQPAGGPRKRDPFCFGKARPTSARIWC